MEDNIVGKGEMLKFDMNSYSDLDMVNVKLFKEIFFKQIEDTISRFSEHGELGAHTLRIITLSRSLFETALEPAEAATLTRFLGIILTKGLKVLEMDIFHDHSKPVYCLPDILLSASSLTSMTIRGCKLPLSLMSPSSIDVRYISLKRLSLGGVPIKERVINRLINGCPRLQEFYLEYCNGFKNFRVLGHLNLAKIQIYTKTGISRVDIRNTPNLCCFFLSNYNAERGGPLVNFDSCPNLTTFCYNGFVSERFTRCFSKFKSIQDLFLCVPPHGNNMGLLIDSLVRWGLQPESVMYPFLNENSSLTKACIDIDLSTALDGTFWVEKVRWFLNKINGFKILKLGFVVGENVTQLGISSKNVQPPPYELDHVELNLEGVHSLAYKNVVHYVLGCCRPRYLTLEFDGFIDPDDDWKQRLLVYTHNMLYKQGDGGGYIRYMLHNLYGWTYHFDRTDDMMKELSKKIYRKITFIKEEDAAAATTSG